MDRTDLLKRRVYTDLGNGKIVHLMPDGTIVVEFDHGGGKIFLPGELRLQAMTMKGRVEHGEEDG